jgi:hypothetical protein
MRMLASQRNIIVRNRFGAIDFSSRRSFLRAMGMGMAAAPFVPVLEAQAQGMPQRLVIVTGHNGVGEMNKYYPSGSATNFTLGSTLASLEPYKKDLILFKDFAGRYASDEAGVHPMASANLLTGSPATRPAGGTIFERQDATRATSISVDQAIAKHIGKSTPHESLVLGCGADPFSAGDHIGGSVSYRGASDPIIAEPNVFKTFRRLWADAAATMTPAPGGKPNPRTGDDRSILDAVSKNLTWLKGRVGAADVRRLDAHLEGVRDIEKRLPAIGAEGGMSMLPSGGCSRPTLPSEDNKATFDTRLAARFMPEILKADIDMIVAAMACDLTRVALLQVGVTTGLWKPEFMGLKSTLHDISHNENANMSKFTERTIRDGYAYLLGRMKSQMEGNGPMLANSACVWTNEFSDGDAHRGSPMPIIAAGQAGGKWQTGRYIQFSTMRRHTDFLVSLCRTFGMNVTKFGTDPTAGPIPELGV